MTKLLQVKLTPSRSQKIGRETLLAANHKNGSYFFWEFNR
jgi:hypothetical protein